MWLLVVSDAPLEATSYSSDTFFTFSSKSSDASGHLCRFCLHLYFGFDWHAFLSSPATRAADGGSGETPQALGSEGEQLAAGRSLHVHHAAVYAGCAGVQRAHRPHLRQRNLQGKEATIFAVLPSVVWLPLTLRTSWKLCIVVQLVQVDPPGSTETKCAAFWRLAVPAVINHLCRSNTTASVSMTALSSIPLSLIRPIRRLF